MSTRHTSGNNSSHTSQLQREIDEFLIDRQVRNLSKRTVSWYRNSLRVLSQFLSEQSIDATEQITGSTIRHFLLSLPAKGYSQGGINNLFGAIKAYLRWYASEYEPANWNPLAKIQTPKRPQEIKQPISLADFQRLTATCTGKDFYSLRDKALLLVLLDTGIRKQELTDLRVGDVDLTTGQIFIRSGKGGKSRVTYCGRATRRALAVYMRQRPDAGDKVPLWLTEEGTALAYHSIRQVIRRRAEEAGIKEPGLHEFRRAFAINFLRNGGDVITLQRLLGHSNLTVINRYLALVDDDLKMSHAKFGVVDHMTT